MKKIIFVIFLFLLKIQSAQCLNPDGSLKFLQINIWLEGTSVEKGFEKIVDVIIQTDPDLVTFSEVENYKNVDFIEKLCDSLYVRGKKYYGHKCFDSGLISRFPILQQSVIYPWNNDSGSITKATVEVADKKLSLYSVHLDYKHYGPYLPRGYDGFTWKKLPSPVSDLSTVVKFNDSSKRIEAIEALIKDATAEKKKGNLILIGGDFNEPSHLDWISSTKKLYDHNGLVIPWKCTKKLGKAGFIDAYRHKYPDPLANPGFTYPSDNSDASVKKLAWAPDADDRDRIDFIFYSDNHGVRLKDIFIVGPSKSISYGKRIDELSKDHFLLPEKGWPSDHKAIMAIFDLP